MLKILIFCGLPDLEAITAIALVLVELPVGQAAQVLVAGVGQIVKQFERNKCWRSLLVE